MEPGPLPGAEAHGGLSAVRGRVSASAASPSHWCRLSCSAFVAPWAFLAGLVILSGHTSLLAEEGPWWGGGKGKGQGCTVGGILFPTRVAVIKPQNAGDWKLAVVMK